MTAGNLFTLPAMQRYEESGIVERAAAGVRGWQKGACVTCAHDLELRRRCRLDALHRHNRNCHAFITRTHHADMRP